MLEFRFNGLKPVAIEFFTLCFFVHKEVLFSSGLKPFAQQFLKQTEPFVLLIICTYTDHSDKSLVAYKISTEQLQEKNYFEFI